MDLTIKPIAQMNNALQQPLAEMKEQYHNTSLVKGKRGILLHPIVKLYNTVFRYLFKGTGEATRSQI